MIDLTPELASQLVELVKLGVERGNALAAVGATEDDYAGWLERAAAGDEWCARLHQELDSAGKAANSRLLLELLSAAKGDWRASAFLLEKAEQSRERDEQQRRQSQLFERLAKLKGSDNDKTLTERRVEHIVDMMCEGTWVPGVSDKLLGEQWDLSRERVRGLASEANHVIRRLYAEDPEASRAQLAKSLQTMERLRQKAESFNSPNGVRVALEAEIQLLTFMGLKPATKIEMPKGKFEGKTQEELEQYLADRRAAREKRRLEREQREQNQGQPPKAE